MCKSVVSSSISRVGIPKGDAANQHQRQQERLESQKHCTNADPGGGCSDDAHKTGDHLQRPVSPIILSPRYLTKEVRGLEGSKIYLRRHIEDPSICMASYQL